MGEIVTIVTPTFNRANELKRLWWSLKNQTFQEYQWVIVDDGSIDNTRDIVSAFSDDRVIYHYQSNKGVNHARNTGDKYVNTPYVVYIDSDDTFLDQDTLHDMVTEIMSTPDDIAWVAFTTTDQYGMHNTTLNFDRKFMTYQDHICEQILSGEFFPIYRSRICLQYSWPNFNGLESLRHWTIVKGRRTLVINKAGRVYYRGTKDQLTNLNSLLSRSDDLYLGTLQLIHDHGESWLQYCGCQLAKYSLYASIYGTISPRKFPIYRHLRTASIYGNNKIRFLAICVAVLYLCPHRLVKFLLKLRSFFKKY